ncbi:hypothetical protein QWT69_15235 [Sporosarcina oncorhynchi]|uniref:Squalene cyclase C-terminal domain-containing protein n=1 Tax=Sporosarcina oncorhynchi TaxID=3056444 RepID=A0ABZ0L5G7_9BACL|nr:hypothetical protein [Sporosarcina sp. T2O-4]WOV87193.1 hypothetical protein QWT69_15235 [Sporosarcina sp. T2O-4]
MDNTFTEQFKKAITFLTSKSRPLEAALYKFEFEDGSRDQVLHELKVYQNEDGGFGNGLEADFRCEASSALATTIGLQHLIRVGADESDPMVQKAIQYALHTFDNDKMGWEIVPKEVESAPRAIWWNYGGDWPWGNPSAEMTGLLHHYKGLVPTDFLSKLTAHAVTYIHQLETNDHHELQCLVKLMKELPAEDKGKVSDKVREIARNSVTTDPEKWHGYCLLPLQVASSPDSFLYADFKDIIPANLQHLLDTQAEDGSWKPTWAWGQFEEEWEAAKQEWSGVLTLENVRVLHAYHKGAL